MSEDLSRPATKADLRDLEARLEVKIDHLDFATRTDLDNFLTKTDGAKFATRDDLQGEMRKVWLKFGKTNSRMDLMEERLKNEMRQLSANLAAKMDGFVTKMESIWRESAVFPLVLDQHGSILKNHEKRLGDLESAA